MSNNLLIIANMSQKFRDKNEAEKVLELVTPTFLVNIKSSYKWRILIKSSFALARARAEELKQVIKRVPAGDSTVQISSCWTAKLQFLASEYFKVQSRSFASLRSELSFPNFTSNDNIFFINQIVSFITSIFISNPNNAFSALGESALTKSNSKCSDAILN